jgi:hypothetical protein
MPRNSFHGSGFSRDVGIFISTANSLWTGLFWHTSSVKPFSVPFLSLMMVVKSSQLAASTTKRNSALPLVLSVLTVPDQNICHLHSFIKKLVPNYHNVHIEYRSIHICPRVGIGTPPPLLPQASVPPPPPETKGAMGTLACR